MKQIFLSLTVLALAAAPLAAHAAPCRDAHGRFIACAHTAATVKPGVKPAAKPAAMHPVAAHATPAPHIAAVPTHAATVTAAKAAPKRCKIGGRFASCAAPGAKPV
jgi:hypothetical protein